MNETRTHVRGPDETPERLDRVLARSIPDISRSRLQALARAGHVAVDHVVSRDPSPKVPGGAALTVTLYRENPDLEWKDDQSPPWRK